MILDLPASVRDYIRKVFSYVNDQVSADISRTPNIHEEFLDISFINNLSHFAGPTVVSAGWCVRIAAHFIGDLRHYDRYEIADIGIVFVFKVNEKVIGKKLALLQSKRLYPTNNQVEELEGYDYMLGLAKIIKSSKNEVSLFSPINFSFTDSCKYGALRAKSDQCKAIELTVGRSGIPVHYLFYNPIVMPWSIVYPLMDTSLELPKRVIGARVIESPTVDAILKKLRKGGSPTFSNFITNHETFLGWTLEDFFADEIVMCQQGYLFEDESPFENVMGG